MTKKKSSDRTTMNSCAMMSFLKNPTSIELLLNILQPSGGAPCNMGIYTYIQTYTQTFKSSVLYTTAW